MSSFSVADPNFCPRCGTVLPRPSSSQQVISCYKCQHLINISVYHERVVHRCIEFNKVISKSDTSAVPQTEGPSVARVCSKCGNPTMTFRTQQTRSADEGQTVFFNCPECGNQEIEYS